MKSIDFKAQSTQIKFQLNNKGNKLNDLKVSWNRNREALINKRLNKIKNFQIKKSN